MQTVYQVLTLLGVPSLITAIIAYIKIQTKKTIVETQAIKLGVQALLRSQMITWYNECSRRGYAEIFERDNYENCFRRYESLGANGVMTDLYNKFMALPTQKGGN